MVCWIKEFTFKKKQLTVLLTVFVAYSHGYGQSDTVYLLDNVIDRMDSVLVSGDANSERIRQYRLLKNRVIKTMPYAKMAAFKIQAMEDKLSTIRGRRARKKYVKQCEKSIKDLYTEQLKKLSINEGKVLMKLLHRETGKTTWEIMKNYRGTPEALFWQAFGSFWGHDMKGQFDPVIDYQIENIIKVERLE